MNENIPFAEYLQSIGITDTITQAEFAHFAYMFASNCFNIAIQSKMNVGEELQGYFHWRTHEPSRFFKVHFSYWHSDDLVFGINKFEEQTFEKYLQSNSEEKSNEIGIFNTESTLASNILKKDSN
jgi:hypothetical protein